MNLRNNAYDVDKLMAAALKFFSVFAEFITQVVTNDDRNM
jgi:hypothetical protein